MKCPIRQMQYVNEDNACHDTLDCIRAKCAWWDKVKKQCGVVTLSTTLAKIEDKMPHEGQFRPR